MIKLDKKNLNQNFKFKTVHYDRNLSDENIDKIFLLFND